MWRPPPATTTASIPCHRPKFTQPLLDTPQTISVISKELIGQQGATTLTEALRNSPGVGTFYVGENGSTSTGDAIYMRGFDTSGSIFVDGVRDIGSYRRDVFNIEQVEVTKGPDGTEYGRTAPTGAVNMVSKQPQLGQGVSGSVSYGSGQQRRATADWNQGFSEHAAFRLNVMGQDSGVRRPRQGREQPLGHRAVTGLRPEDRYPRLPRLPAREAEQRARRRRLHHRPARLQQPRPEPAIHRRCTDGRPEQLLRH